MTLPCGCETNTIDWETDMDNFEFDGECHLQPGTCNCGENYYKRWSYIGLIDETGHVMEDYSP
jgi:hypothetical protein